MWRRKFLLEIKKFVEEVLINNQSNTPSNMLLTMKWRPRYCTLLNKLWKTTSNSHTASYKSRLCTRNCCYIAQFTTLVSLLKVQSPNSDTFGSVLHKWYLMPWLAILAQTFGQRITHLPQLIKTPSQTTSSRKCTKNMYLHQA